MSLFKFSFSFVFLLLFAQAQSQSCADIPGFTKIGELAGHGYYLSNEKKTWLEAKQVTIQNGGYLAALTTPEENEFVRERLNNNMVFIGFNDAYQEGSFNWTSGEPVSFDLSTNNNDNNDFAVMNFWNGQWKLGGKWQQRKYVMEVNCGQDPSSNSPVQVFIFSGQSNMSGAGKTAELYPAQKIVPANVSLKTYFYGIEYTDFSGGNFGPELEFIQEIAYANPEEKYLFIKYAWGGTGINQWLPGTNHYETLKNKIYQALGSLNADYELAAFAWMQGETDAFSPIAASAYKQNLTLLVNSLRNDLGEPDLAVLIGQANPPNACCVSTVQLAEEEFVNEDAHAALVYTDGVARHYYDPIHYSTSGQIDLGHRFFAAYQTIEPAGFVLHCPESMEVIVPAGQNTMEISWELDDVVSDCGLVEFWQIAGPISGAELAIGDYEVSYAAIDDCDYTDTCHFSIAVKEAVACPSKVEGFTKLGDFGNHAYFLSEKSLTWLKASASSAELGGYLTTINSAEENEFLQTNLNGEMVFVGFSDHLSEGVPGWSNGEPVIFDESYGNNDMNDYAVMNFWAGTWEMVNHWVAKKFVLEIDCIDSDFQSDYLTGASLNSELVSVFPNPAIADIEIMYSQEEEKEVVFQIFNKNGYLFLSEKRFLPQGESKVRLNVSDLQKGAYSLRILGLHTNFSLIKL